MATELIEKFAGKKVPREAPPPSRWGQSKSGTARFVVRKVGFRNKHGQKLYRLGFWTSHERGPLFSQQLWTLAELTKAGVVWLNESPFGAISDELTVDTEMPKDAFIDHDVDEPKLGKIGPDEPPAEPPKRRHPPMPPDRPLPEPVVEPKKPGTFEANYPWKVGDVCKHTGGNLYRILAIVDENTCRVEQVLADGKKTPARNMSASKLSRPA